MSKILDRKTYKKGYEDFLLVSEEAEKRNTPDLTLDEINDVISKARKEMNLKEEYKTFS